ncbi:MAG TPA: hypothetical protein VK827_01700, partial [Lysobacter sp.]|nr:hypothetical protein [Lysobacter sp.]
NSSTGANQVWISGDHTNPQSVTGVTNLAWRVAAIGDYNGDGRSDILWRHSGDGSNVVWRSGSWARQQPIVRVGDLSWTIKP